MKREDVLKYIREHPDSLFHITTFKPLGVIRHERILTDTLISPITGKPITIYKNTIEEIRLDDFVAYVVTDSLLFQEGNLLPVVLDNPHHMESAKNWTTVAYDNISSIEAV